MSRVSAFIRAVSYTHLDVYKRQGALCEELDVRESYLKPYLERLLGQVVKCRSIDELRGCRIGVTPDCMVYHTFRLQQMNPEQYTKSVYIGKDSVRQRIRLLEKSLAEMENKRAPEEKTVRELSLIHI